MNTITLEQQNKRALTIKLNSALVTIDCAKAEHVCQILHPVHGVPLLNKAIHVNNDNAGMERLLKCLNKTCSQNNLDYQTSIFVMEDPASYTQNFIYQLQKKGFKCYYVNARVAKSQRKNTRASSDELDLDGIGSASMSGHMININEDQVLYKKLNESVHNRAYLVKEQTAYKSVTHTHIDELFPGFLNSKKSGIEPFSQGCVQLMLRPDFSVYNYAKKRLKQLTVILQKNGFHEPAKLAVKIKTLAQEAVKPPKEMIDNLKQRVQQGLKLYRQRLKCIEVEEKVMAELLAQTAGFYLTSIPGISIVLASYIMAELGNPLFWRSADQIGSYAGVIPRQKQSGGQAKEPIVKQPPRDCNRKLKNAIYSAVSEIKLFEHPSIQVSGHRHELKAHFDKVEARGGSSWSSTAKKLIRVMRAMVKSEDIYMPRSNNLTPHRLAAWVEIETTKMFTKWATYGVRPNENNKLGEWQTKKEDIMKLLVK